MLTRILSMLGLFPTIRVCSYCRRWYGFMLGGATSICKGRLYIKSHGICPKCARGMGL